MKMVVFAFLMTLALPLAADPIVLERATSQLFVDDYLIERQEGLERTLHQPVKDNGGNTPVFTLPADSFAPYSFTLEANGSIVYDVREQKWVLFALGFSSEMSKEKSRNWERVRLYRFTSTDGISWSEGEWVFPRSKDDFLDAASGRRASSMDLFSCYYDKKDAEYPYKGLMWYANWGYDMEGAYHVRSKDGQQWERVCKVFEGNSGQDDPVTRRIQQGGRELVGAGDVTIFTYDEPTNRYLALIKFYAPKPVEFNNQLRSRAHAWLDRLDAPFDMNSIDHVELVPAAAEANGDMPHDEYYASTAWRCGSMWLGGLKVWHGGGDYPYSAAGCAFMKLAYSRDGLKWTKVPYRNEADVAEVWLANGPEGGNGGRNDGGYMTEFSTGPMRMGDEMVYYYGSSSWGKNHPTGQRITSGGIFRARMRVDGYVSAARGTITTKPLIVKGDRLTLNSSGDVVIEVLSERNDALGATKLTGDSLQNAVVFEGKELGELVGNRSFRLRFTIGDGARLYAFAIN